MKKALAILCAVFALETKAVPFLDVEYEQVNWLVDWSWTIHDTPAGANNFRSYIDGILVGSGPAITGGGGSGLSPLPTDWATATAIYNPGEHFIWMLFDVPGVATDFRVDGDESYFLVAPTGHRPGSVGNFVPDSSTTGTLALISVAGLLAFKKIAGQAA